MQYGCEPNFQIVYASIHTTYFANFVKITDTVPQIQHLNFKSSLFQVDMHHIEYAQIANQIFIASSTVQIFQS